MDELLDSAPCGYLSFTDAGLIIDINSTLVDLLRYAPGELTNQKFESIVTISSRIFFQTYFFPLLRLHGAVDEVFFSLRSKDNQAIPVLVNAVRREQAGQTVNVCILMPIARRQIYENEILQAKRAAQDALSTNEELIQAKEELERYTEELDRKVGQLEQKNREHLRVTQILFHDLWEPLRKILTFTDLLVQDGHVVTNSPAEAMLMRVRAAAATISALLRSLQEFTTVNTAQEPLSAVDLNEALLEARQLSVKAGQKCEIATTPLPTVEGYRQQLVQLFVQLIDNSIQFCKPDLVPTISITATLVQHNRYRVSKDRYRYVDYVKVVYQDNSYGFDNQYNQAVFGLLTKFDSASRGPGVGLAICQKIVENHSGSITAHSEVGNGVTFAIMLPLEQDFSSTATPQQVEPTALQ